MLVRADGEALEISLVTVDYDSPLCQTKGL